MFKFITRVPPNDHNSQPREDKSFIDIKVRINEELLMKLLPWLLSISIAGGGIYGAYNVLSPSNTEIFDSSNQIESVK